MQKKWTGGAVLLAGVLALTGCSGSKGSDGASGPMGPQGQQGAAGEPGAPGAPGADGTQTVKLESCEGCHADAGTQHQALYNSFADGINPSTTKFAASIVSVVTSAGTNTNTFKSTVTFTLTKAGTTSCATPSTLKQKTMYFVTYDDATKKFVTPPYVQSATDDPTGELGGTVAGSPQNFSYGSMTLTDAATCTYTMVKDNLTADPLGAANAFVYGYFGDTSLNLPANFNTARHYALMDNMVSVSKVVKGTIGYTSTATVSGCERCHGAPYSKHGYRQATVAGLNDFVACKACHTDARRGTDAPWYLLVDDPAALAAQGGTLTPAQQAKYAYVANVMQDTHNSHAFEFAYPQSMANCTTCHEGHLAEITANTQFKLSTCKSCHPVTNTAEKRAPALKTLLSSGAAAPYHSSIDLYSTDPATDAMCQGCHGNPVIPFAPVFSQLHNGRDAVVYKADGSKYAAAIKAQVDSASFDSATKKVVVKFSVTGANAGAVIKPTVVMSLYGWSGKDFVVSGHGSQPKPTDTPPGDGKRNLEWAEGASGNSARLTVVPGATAASWVATADLSLWAGKLSDGSVKRVEVAILPAIGIDQGQAPQKDQTKANYNPYLAVTGVTKTISVASTSTSALVADATVYGRNIVDAAKCNKCHEALGTTFHDPAYGSAGVLACRVCHTVNNGGSHLEMQSRSIDSYVHALHSFQKMDVGGIDFADPVAAMFYAEHVDAVYPNFAIQNCESCHNPGTYDVPDQAKSLPGILSGSVDTNTTWTRQIKGVPSVVTGPAMRACGSCHRSMLINEDAASGLAALNGHMGEFGTQVTNDTGVLDEVTEAMMSIFKY